MVAIARSVWPFVLTSTVQLSKTFPPGPHVSDVLDVLHDPQQATRLSPLVFSVTPDPAKGDGWFKVKESLPIFGGIFNGSTSYELKWTSVEGGGNGDVEADLGTKLHSEMRVKEQNGLVQFTETLTVEALALFMPFVKDTMTDAHTKMQDVLIAKVQENMKKKGTST